MTFLKRVEQLKKEGLEERHLDLVERMYLSYRTATETEPGDDDPIEKIYLAYLEKIAEQIRSPFSFPPYHASIRSPFDYLQNSIEIMRGAWIKEKSVLIGEKELEKIEKLLAAGENVIFLGNHQIEPDPQILHLFLEGRFDTIRERLIFVAGDRVTTDPLAIPFSLGCNLFCIYSKRRIEHPPEKKTEKLLHNQKTMRLMQEKLSEGGWCIYVAPSGGRDRKNSEGEIEISPFSASSVELLHLTAKQATRPTHFFPLALKTYDLLPPPETVELELGEERIVGRAPAGLAIGEEFPMEPIEGSSKKEARELRAQEIHQEVQNLYQQLR